MSEKIPHVAQIAWTPASAGVASELKILERVKEIDPKRSLWQSGQGSGARGSFCENGAGEADQYDRQILLCRR
jgi:hypothetical protein